MTAQFVVTLESEEEAQLLVHKLELGEYYKKQFTLSTERIAVLEEINFELKEENSMLVDQNEKLVKQIEAFNGTLDKTEETISNLEKAWRGKTFRVGAICLGLGIVVTTAFLVTSI